MRDAIEQFRTAMHNAGLTPPEVLEPDGKLHRFATNEKRRDNAGWYVFYGDGLPAGQTGEKAVPRERKRMDRSVLGFQFRVCRSAMVEHARKCLDPLMERAAERHVPLLDAPADGEHRHARANRRAGKAQHRAVAWPRRARCRAR